MLPGWKSAFRAGFWPDCYRESTDIGPAAARPAEGSRGPQGAENRPKTRGHTCPGPTCPAKTDVPGPSRTSFGSTEHIRITTERHSMLRKSASGPEIGLPGRILAGLLSGKHRNRPSDRPKAGRRADFDASSPAKIWLGKPIYGPA
jgi:hypothetical protein